MRHDDYYSLGYPVNVENYSVCMYERNSMRSCAPMYYMGKLMRMNAWLRGGILCTV